MGRAIHESKPAARARRISTLKKFFHLSNKEKSNFTFKFLMCMGLIMLYLTIVYILPFSLDINVSKNKIIIISAAYIPFACWYFNNI